MAEEKPIKYKPRVPPWILGGLVLILFTVLVLLQSSNYWKDIAVDSTSDTLLLYALSSLNFFAFVIFGNISEPTVERTIHKQVGKNRHRNNRQKADGEEI